MNRVFADTSFFIALFVPNDVAHGRAQAMSAKPMRLVTTAWVLTELGAYFSAPSNRSLFTTLLASLRAHPDAEFVPATQDLFDRAAELYASRPDKAWSMVDCTSFIIMQSQGLTDALTSDQHFIQAGFKALLAAGN